MAATNFIGGVGPKNEMFEVYSDRTEMFFVANNITEVAGNTPEQVQARVVVHSRKERSS